VLRYRVFISSPGDVGPERAIAQAVTERLQFEFRGQVEVETYLWERSLLRATDTFQAQIVDIQEADLAIFILWSRIGTPLPLDQFSRPDGSQFNSGTEYEFERAREGYDKTQSPEILCYLKTAEVRLPMNDRELRTQRVAEFDAVNRFTDKWFRNPDGTFKSAFYNFEKTAQFEELIEVHLRDWIRERLKSVTSTPAVQPMWKGSPFRGLQAFDFEHAVIYCGRTALISEILEGLRRRGAAGHGFLMVTGMSGVGKSSLIRAGVLPMLTRPRVIERVSVWRRVIFKPNVGDEKLLSGFAASLVQPHALPELESEAGFTEDVLQDPAAFTSALTRALDRATKVENARSVEPDPSAEVRLVIFCDQFEEIFDETIALQERIAFVEALRAVITTGRVWVIAALRADFFSRCSELPERFRDLFIERDGIFTVGGPRPAEIVQMIRRPAMIAGLQFERRGDPEEGLDDVLRDAAAGNPTILPLLEFTLDELWRRSAGSGLLRFSDYEDLGGLHGALRLRADEVFSGLPAAVQASLPKVLAALVHTDPTDERLVLQNRVALDQWSGAPECRDLIAAFVAAHLLVGDRASDGTAVVGLAHEALLREWPPAVRWIEENRELLRLRSGIAAAAALWRNSEMRQDRLIVGPLLKDAAKLSSTHPEMLAADERRFVDLSVGEERTQRRSRIRRGAAIASAVVLAILLPVIGFGQISYGLSFARSISAVWNGGSEIPVSAAALAKLDKSVDALAQFLVTRAGERANRPELTAWSLSQMWAALLHREPTTMTGPELREAVTATRDPICYCWRETDDKLPHSMATAWVVFSLALYDQSATVQEIEGILDRQGATGWWSMFPSGPEEGNASTAATAFNILALHEQIDHKLVSAAQQPKVSAAIDRGIKWLTGRIIPGKARWTEYPPETTFERGVDYRAVSALAIYVLRRVTGSTELDAAWLNNLPQAVPTPGESEQSKGYVFVKRTQVTLDDVRHYRYPWMLRTTIDSYANADVFQRARALLWLEEALAEAPSVADLNSEAWTSAEVLFALRHAQSALHRNSGGKAQSALPIR
jgi:hypothetical protein